MKRSWPEDSGEWLGRAYQAFLAAFNAEYNGKRTPFQAGFHFVLMNDGAYWRALERFAGEVCSKPEVACINYRDYLAQTQPRAAKGPSDAALGG